MVASLDERLTTYSWPDWIKKASYQVVTTDAGVNAVISAVERADLTCLDFETTGLSTHRDNIVGAAISVAPGAAWYVSVAHLGDNVSERAFTALLDVLRRAKLLYWNAKFDHSMALYRLGVSLPITHDAMMRTYLVDPNVKDLRLKRVGPEVLKLPAVDVEEDIGVDFKQENLGQCHAASLYPYPCQDVDLTLRLFQKYEGHKSLEGQDKIYDLELRLMPVVGRMEYNGVLLDVAGLEHSCTETEALVAQIQAECWRHMGEEIDLDSPKQVGRVLFEVLGLPVHKRTPKTGQPSTGEKSLEAIRTEHLAVDALLCYKAKNKLVNSFLRTLPEYVDETTGRVHANFKQHGTASGRFSCKGPNLQQIPKRDEEAKELVRGCFIASPGSWWGAFDFDQIEYRIFASMARIRGLMEQIVKGHDVHRATAAMMFDTPYDQVTTKQRQDGKNINFALIYGQGEQALAATLERSVAEAKRLRESYFAQMPEAAAFIRKQHIFVRQHGYVKTQFGRRRPLNTLIYSNDRKYVADALRRAVNTPIQGTAADIIKIAMVRADEVLRKEFGYDKARMIMSVHDELDFEFADDVPKVVAVAAVRKAMEVGISGYVPITVTCETGPNWGQMETWEGEPKPIVETTPVLSIPAAKSLPTVKGLVFPALVIEVDNLSEEQAAFLRLLFEKNPGGVKPYVKVGDSLVALPDGLNCSITDKVIEYVEKALSKTGQVSIHVYNKDGTITR